jgi:tRNA(Ile)-lysidine synthase
LGEQLWWQQNYLEKQAARQLRNALLEEKARCITLDAGRLSRFDRSLDPFVLRELIRRLGLSLVPTPSTVERFLQLRRGSGSGRVEQGGFVVERSKGQIAAYGRTRHPAASRSARPADGDPVSDTSKWEIRTEVVDEVSREQFDDRRQVFLDLGKVRQPVRLRPLQAGDRYRPLGLDGTKKLLDLLADHKIPAFQRRDVPVLIDQDGILWPVGQPIADRVKVTRRTRQILRVMVQHL